MKQRISIVIPVKEINNYLRLETIPAILKQTYRNFEVIIVPDKPSKEKFSQTKIVPSWPKTGPADKRDLGVKQAKGSIIAFLDDDSYPNKNWLKNTSKIFENSEKVTGVCGPNLTPPHNNLCQKAGGYVWSTWLGSGGAGTYRCAVSSRREVDDYPSVNLFVRRKDFLRVGGFNSHFWPGEDTKLCHDLVYRLGKKIIYDPNVLVYHHRREVFGPHLKQISRYAIHRGHFARILPKTSLRPGYFLPTIFTLGLISGPFLAFLWPSFRWIYLFAIAFYGLALLITVMGVYSKEKNLRLALLVIPAIFVTHIIYGILFIKGFFSAKLER